MESGIVAVECVNFDRCKGKVTFQPRWGDVDVASHPTMGGLRAETVGQTWGCEYSEEQKEELAKRAIAMVEGRADWPWPAC